MKSSHLIAGFTLLSISIAGYYFLIQPTKLSDNISICPAIEGSDIPFSKYIIHPDRGIIIETHTGTQLTIPAGCFQRADKKTPQDSVIIQVREMHDPYSIFLSGIPMEIAGSGGKNLESGGMIEVRAYERGNELSLKEGQTIGIELAAFRKEDNYDLYYLEDNTAWTIKDSFTRIPNERKIKKINTLSATIKKINDSLITDEFVFVIEGDTVLNPELRPFIGQEWLFLEKDKMEIAKKAMRQNWSKVDISVKNRRKMEYRIRFQFDEETVEATDMNETFEVLAKPVMNERNSKRKNRRQFSEKMQEYELLVKQTQEELERVKLQADLVNSFKAGSMGVWNIDKIMKEEIIITKADFDFASSLKGPQKDHFVYMIMEENNSVIYVRRNEWPKFPFPGNKRFSIVAVLTDGTIASIAYEEIRQKLKPGQSQISFAGKKMQAKDFVRKMQLIAKR